MGCDIHLFVEKRIEGRWEPVSVPKGWDPGAEEWIAKCPNTTISPEWYPHRHYGLFARLADVRNRDNVAPLDAPRGLPTDVSVGVKQEWDDGYRDWHSASWFTAAELVASPTPWDDLKFEEIIAHMLTLGAPSEVRIVFWFDN
jgi:hypothetical protein